MRSRCSAEWSYDPDDEDVDGDFHWCEYSEDHVGEHRCHCGAIIAADEIELD